MTEAHADPFTIVSEEEFIAEVNKTRNWINESGIIEKLREHYKHPAYRRAYKPLTKAYAEYLDRRTTEMLSRPPVVADCTKLSKAEVETLQKQAIKEKRFLCLVFHKIVR